MFKKIYFIHKCLKYIYSYFILFASMVIFYYYGQMESCCVNMLSVNDKSFFGINELLSNGINLKQMNRNYKILIKL